MADSHNKIFIWQLGIAAVVGILWGLLWEIPSSETGFFVDLPFGIFIGFVIGLAVVVGVAVVGGGIWAVVTMTRGSGGLGEAMSSNLDQLGASSLVESTGSTLDSWNGSGVVMGVKWAIEVALVWGLAGGLVWGLELGFAPTAVAVLVFGFGGALLISEVSGVSERLAESLSGGYGWLDFLSSAQDKWESWGLSGFWAFAGAVALGIGGVFAAGGLGAGIVQAIVLGLVALIAALLGGVAGAYMKQG